MTINLGLRAFTVLAFVAASTAVIIQPELIGGPAAEQVRTIGSIVALSHP